MKFIDTLRTLQIDIRIDIKGVSVDELQESQTSLITSIALLVAIVFIAPIILVFNRNIAVMGQVSEN